MPYADYQYEIYLAGMGGQVPELPTDLDALEPAARERLEDGPFGYVAGSAGTESTARANREAFERRRLVPRFLCDVAERDLSRTVLGTPMPAPVLLAPIGVQTIVHPEGEVATARAAAGLDVPFVLSTASSYALEEVAAAAGDGPRWFQLYWPKHRDVAASLVTRAQAVGFSALVVTLDTFMLAWRPRDLAGAYLPFLRSEGIANYLTDPVFRSQLAASPEDDPMAAVVHFLGMFGDPTKTWADLGWLREQWSGPIALKGVLHPDDARRAADAGMDGVVVSNHGGRQVDGAIASLDALPGVVQAVGDRLEVLLDSGIRGGADVAKALALGARAVLLGRPYVYGLALAGETGVRHVLRSLLAELDLTLALTGCRSLDDLGPDLLAQVTR
jgi:isopentenyl diphosphate isomerase/L-lactate dehydrogenase-like FMN-dependent dehydrogenase